MERQTLIRFKGLYERLMLAQAFFYPQEAPVIKVKKEIRDLQKAIERNEQIYPEWKGFHNNYDRRWYKEVYNYEFSEKEKQSYCNCKWETIHSLYDCTGRWFTQDIRIFCVNGKTIIYHIQGRDV